MTSASLQLALTSFVLLALAVMPPAQGRITVLSLTGQSPGAIARWALRADARIVGRGPTSHSIVVEGDRAGLVGAALANGSLLLTGMAGACGEGPRA